MRLAENHIYIHVCIVYIMLYVCLHVYRMYEFYALGTHNIFDICMKNLAHLLYSMKAYDAMQHHMDTSMSGSISSRSHIHM